MPNSHSSSFASRSVLLLAACLLGVAALAAPSGCSLYKDNSLYCEERPGSYCECRLDADCTTAGKLVCELEATNTCVECTTANASACTGTKPVCGTNYACRGCNTHADCPASAACLPDGSCAAEPMVAYVAPMPMGTDNDTCSKATPCTRVAKALATMRPYIKFAGTTSESITVAGGRQVTFLAEPGARLRSGTNNVPNVTVRDTGTSLTIYDLTIADAPNDANGFGVLVPSGSGTPKVALVRATVTNNPARGISISGGSLSLLRSVVSSNTGGGVSVVDGTTFEIINNFFFANGGINATVGGLSVATVQNAANRVEFNSFYGNQAQGGTGPGIQCTAGDFTARNNILSGNGGGTQYAGSCLHTHSIFTPGELPAGAGNSAAAPMFLSTSTGNLHISATSPARGMADPATVLSGPTAVDIDGEPRSTPADIGADEVP